MSIAQFAGFLNTPALWDGEQFEIQQFEFPQVSLASFQAKPTPTNIRLGHQMEYVFQQLVEHSGMYSVVLYNLPIRQEGITLGEIDFILRHRETGQFLHVELTYKFYLIDPDIPEPVHRLIGPNRRDTFFAKMQKIRDKQFPLVHAAEGIQALNAARIDHLKLQHQCCFKAQLFHPYGVQVSPIGSLNENCVAGHWLRLPAFNSPAFAKAQYYMPSKLEWVIEPHNEVHWRSYSETLALLKDSLSKKMAPMLWIKWPHQAFEKVFVVWW